MKKLAIWINDCMAAVGLGLVGLFTFVGVLTVEPSLIWAVLLISVIALIVWAITSGLWCVLSGIHDELKKLNEKA